MRCIILALATLAAITSALPWDISRAETDLFYSYAAYCSDITSAWDCKWCQKLPDFKLEKQLNYKALDTSAFYGYDSGLDAIYVSFRGTHNIENWITNLNFTVTPMKEANNTHVHQGFLNAVEQMWPDMYPGVQTLMQAHATAKVRVTGHSMGASFSVLFATKLYAALDLTPAQDLITIYNYGLPRTGHQDFAVWFDARIPTIRVVNQGDVVPHVPPADFITHFTHVNEEVWYKGGTAASDAQVCASAPGTEDHACSWSVSVFDFSVEDHLHYLGYDEDCDDDSSVARQYTDSELMDILKARGLIK